MNLFKELSKFLKNKIFKEEFVHLLITIFFVFVIYILEQEHKNFTTLQWTLCILLMLFLCVVYVVMRLVDINTENNKKEEIKQKEEEQRRELEIIKPVSVKFNVNKLENNHMKDIAYEVSLNEVKKAKHRIIIVADYSPANEEFIVSPMRQKYYKAIENILEEKIKHNSNQPFTYIRYMQRDMQTFKLILDKKGVIDAYNLVEGDEQAFHHCKRVLEIAKHKENINLELYVTKNIPSIPSILIVDNNKLLFTIPERIKKRRKLETAGVLDFTDNTYKGTAIVEPFLNIVNSLKEDYGDEVIRLASVADFQEEAFKKWL